MERSEAGSVVPGTLWKSEAEWDTSFCWAIRFLQFEIRSTGAGRVDSIAGLLPGGWTATLRAVDGAGTNDVPGQLRDLPVDATHLVLSAGGNDLLGCAGEILRTPVAVSSEVFLMLARVAGAFETTYRRVVETCLKTGLPLVVCTIYTGTSTTRSFRLWREWRSLCPAGNTTVAGRCTACCGGLHRALQQCSFE